MAMLGIGDYLCEACKHFDTDGDDGNHPYCMKQRTIKCEAIPLGQECPFGYEFGIPISHLIYHNQNEKRALEIKAKLDKLYKEWRF